MGRRALTLSTAVAPALWGTTYLTATAALPAHHPLFTAMMRALPIGILLTLLLRQLPTGVWWWRSTVLGTLNIALTFAMLFIAAYRLPGGVAATIGSVQPLIVALLGWPLLGLAPTSRVLGAGLTGVAGVGMLVLGGSATLDLAGVAAALAATCGTATGVVLTKRWGHPGSVLALTGWQLTAGGLLLAPFALVLEGAPHALTPANIGGYLYLGLIGTGLAYALWFRGIGRLPATAVSFLSLLIPLVATLAGFLAYHQALTILQLAGMLVVVGSIVVAQRAGAGAPRGSAPAPARPRPQHALTTGRL